MPYKFYHGKTGIVYNVTKSAVGVIVHKRVGNRYVEKRVNIRIEHIYHSKCREEFVRRVKDNAARRKEAKTNGEHVHLKRLIPLPRDAKTVSTKDNLPQTIVPIPYETTI
jgi:large subunit ribosomal protein L21e